MTGMGAKRAWFDAHSRLLLMHALVLGGAGLADEVVADHAGDGLLHLPQFVPCQPGGLHLRAFGR